jgi:hypothetical protein
METCPKNSHFSPKQAAPCAGQRPRVARVLALALAALPFASCALAGQSLAVDIRMPPFPDAWRLADFWELRVERGGLSSAPILARPGDAFSLSLPRGSPAYLYCSAAFGEKRSLPFGAVWPQQGLPSDTGPPGLALPLTAGGGFAAAFGALLDRGGIDAAGFNLDRFGREAEARVEDPWTLDVAALARSVAGGSFRADSLRESPETSAERLWLPLELAGATLVPSSPWAEALSVAADGSLTLPLCYRPRVYFVRGYELRAGLSPEGEPCWSLSVMETSGAGGL